jgi:alkanesulfonate monooxygenase SsuD/methylene tetrahydromethanopterin reductase-like flavin-dependent oxidoreductase (luciferase family)
MKFVAFTLITHRPDPATGILPSQHDRIADTVRVGQLVEQLGFDAYQIGERHGAPFLCSSPTVLLTAVAAHTSRIRLLTGVTVLTLHDPLQIAEEYALLDHISDGRLDLVVALGYAIPQYEIYELDPAEQRDAFAEKYRLLRRLWSEENVTWSGRFRGPLTAITSQPRPYQDQIRIWHGSSTNLGTTELAAQNGDPLFSGNGFSPMEPYRALIDHYRQRWSDYGHAGEPVLGVGFPSLLIRDTSQEAVEAYRPFWNELRSSPAFKQNKSPFWELEEFIEQGSALIGSPQQVIEKLHAYTEIYQQQLTAIGVDALPFEWQQDQLERFAADIIPPLRRAFPDSIWQTSEDSLEVATSR